jgi:transposase-like protein
MAEGKRMTADEVVGYLLEEDHVDFLRESLRWFVERLMDAEGDRVDRRRPRRAHGGPCHPPQWLSPAALGHARRRARARDPEAAPGSYFPSFLQPRKRSEQALLSVIQQAVSRRARSTRSSSRSVCASRAPRSRASPMGSTSRSRPSALDRSRAATPTSGSTPRCATRRCRIGRGARPRRRAVAAVR